jgi:hypothetical protein
MIKKIIITIILLHGCSTYGICQNYYQLKESSKRNDNGRYNSNNPYQIPEQQKNIYNGDNSKKYFKSNDNLLGNTEANAGDLNDIGFVDDVPSTPVDGGIGFLIAAGVGYGVRRLRKNNLRMKTN